MNLTGKKFIFLQAELKDNKIFAAALADFEVCEVKDIESVETVYYDTKGIVLTDISKIDISTAICKTILTPIKVVEPIITK